MSIKMVREPSETPNITNIDDIIPFRYAYGNQNGYVKDKGNEIGYTINGSQFTVGSGRLVLQGVESDISASGVTIEIDSANELRYYVIYLQVNLALNTVSILNQYDTADYPTISAGDDLTAVSTGIANLPLYKFTANNGVISDVQKIVQEVKLLDKYFDSLFNNSNKTKFGDYIISKKLFLAHKQGTIADNRINLDSNLAGRKFEIHFKDTRISPQIVFGDSKIYFEVNDTSKDTGTVSNVISVTTSGNTVNFHSIVIEYTISTGIIVFHSFTNTFPNSITIDGVYAVTEVYEVFE